MVTRGKGRWLYDSRTGRWRHNGKFAAKPPRSALRKDVRGRLIDDAGRRVPEAALPAKKRPAKKKAVVKPKAAKRAKKPKRASAPVRPRHVRGGMSDAFRRAVEEVQAEYGRAPTPTITGTSEISKITRGQTIVAKEFQSSSFINRHRPENLADIYTRMLERAASKGPFQPEDIVVYEHGLKFVGHERLSPEVLAALQSVMPDGGHIRFADTKAGTEVYVYLGAEPKIGSDTANSFKNSEEALQRIYDVLLDYWDSVDWYEWFETDESLYE